MIKAARKADANAMLAWAFADIFRAPTHEHIATQRRGTRLQRGGVRMCGALRERPWREAMRALIKSLNSSEESGRKCHARMSICGHFPSAHTFTFPPASVNIHLPYPSNTGIIEVPLHLITLRRYRNCPTAVFVSAHPSGKNTYAISQKRNKYVDFRQS